MSGTRKRRGKKDGADGADDAPPAEAGPGQPAPEAPEQGPEAIRRTLAVLAAASGAPPPGDGREVPPVNKMSPISSLARSCGQILRPAPIFRFAGELVTVSEAGEIEPMASERFCSWAEQFLSFVVSTKDGPAVESIGKDLAGKILAADQFKRELRELKAVHCVRLPVWQGAGQQLRIGLAREGFDQETGILTIDGLRYRHDASHEEAIKFFADVLRHYPFESEGEPDFYRRRSFSAMLAAMIGAYCWALFPEGTARPFVIFNANQSGSGKSTLMRMVICPAHGMPGDDSMPRDENELRKRLSAAAFCREPFFLLDDVENLKSHALNSFITSPMHKDRVMNSQKTRSVGKITQVLASGNDLRITPDLDRRALIVDLFEAGDAGTRTFPRDITTEWLGLADTRAAFLAHLWALVRDWVERGMEIDPECRRGSFELWSRIVGSIVTHAGFSNPFAPRSAVAGGDEASHALRSLLIGLVSKCESADAPKLSTDEILAEAQALGVVDVIVGSAKDDRKALGWRLRKLRGRQFVDGRGRQFEFGRREVAAGASYPIRFLSGPGTVAE